MYVLYPLCLYVSLLTACSEVPAEVLGVKKSWPLPLFEVR